MCKPILEIIEPHTGKYVDWIIKKKFRDSKLIHLRFYEIITGTIEKFQIFKALKLAQNMPDTILFVVMLVSPVPQRDAWRLQVNSKHFWKSHYFRFLTVAVEIKNKFPKKRPCDSIFSRKNHHISNTSYVFFYRWNLFS